MLAENLRAEERLSGEYFHSHETSKYLPKRVDNGPETVSTGFFQGLDSDMCYYS
jgi:hypothetical protein